MNKFLVSLLILNLSFFISIAQLVEFNVDLSNAQYARAFNAPNNQQLLANALQEMEVDWSDLPVQINICEEGKSGIIELSLPYHHQLVFHENSAYTQHHQSRQTEGKGVGVLFQYRLFKAMQLFLKSVAAKGFNVNEELLKYKLIIHLHDEKGNWVRFYASTLLEAAKGYPLVFNRNVNLMYEDKSYQMEASHPNRLNEVKFFYVGKSTTLEGHKNGTYFFNQFFNIPND